MQAARAFALKEEAPYPYMDEIDDMREITDTIVAAWEFVNGAPDKVNQYRIIVTVALFSSIYNVIPFLIDGAFAQVNAVYDRVSDTRALDNSVKAFNRTFGINSEYLGRRAEYRTAMYTLLQHVVYIDLFQFDSIIQYPRLEFAGYPIETLAIILLQSTETQIVVFRTNKDYDFQQFKKIGAQIRILRQNGALVILTKMLQS